MLQNYGPWFDVQGAGVYSVLLIGGKDGNKHHSIKDLSFGKWTYQVGVEGEYIGLDKVSQAKSSLWMQGNSVPVNKSLIWYKVNPMNWAAKSRNLLSFHLIAASLF